MPGFEPLVKGLEIIFKTLCWLFIICAILLFPLTLPVRVGMIVLAVAVVTAPKLIRRRKQ